MALKFRRGNTAQQSGSLAFGEPYFNTDFNTLVVGSTAGDVVLASAGTSSAFVGAHVSASGYVSASSLEITGNANIGGDVTIGGKIQIGDNTSDTVNVVASLSSSLIPSLTNTFDLGDLTHFWRDLYISTGSIKMVNPATNQVVTTINAVAGGGIQIGNIQITTASIAFVDNSGNVTQNVAQSSSAGTISDYVTTGSFNAYTSSTDFSIAAAFQSASSYSGSAATVATTNSASAAGAFASASSYSGSAASALNSLSSSVASKLGQSVNPTSDVTFNTITANEFHITTISSSVLFKSGSTKFGDSSDDTHQFTGSIYTTNDISSSTINGIGNVTSYSSSVASRLTTVEGVSGSGASALGTLSSSIASTDNTQTTNITANSASAWGAFQSASSYSGSFYTTINTNIGNINTNSASAWGAFQSASAYSSSAATVAITNANSAAGAFASASSYSGSFYTTINTNIGNITTAQNSANGAYASASAYSASAATVAITNANSAAGAYASASAYSASAATVAITNANSAAGAFASASSYSGSFYTTINTAIGNINSNSQSAAGAFASASAYSSSAATTYAVLNRANTFTGTQTITGSLYVSANLIVQGSSSLQNITASAASIGTNTVILNTATPSVRFGGISVQDSGSGAGTSGSLLWDSQNDVWIYQQPSGAVEGYQSARLISGPKNSGSLGGELGLTVGQVPVAVGDDHIGDSIISASATKVTIAGGLDVTGALSASTITGFGNVTTYSSSVASRVNTLETSTTVSTLSSSVATDFSASTAARVALSASIASTDSTQTTNITAASASAWGAFQSASSYSGSFYTTINNTTASVATISASAWGAFQSASSYSGSFYTTINTAIGNITTAQNSANGAYASASAYSSSFAAATTTINGTGVKIGTTNTITAAANTLTDFKLPSTVTGSSLTSVGTITTGVWNGTAIANGNLANSSVTVTAGTGMSGGGAVALGSSVTLTNAGVTSNVAGTGVSVSGATGAVTISIGQAVATTDNVRFNSVGVGMAASATAGRIDAAGDVVAYSSSDKNFKENITPIENPIEKIRKISGNTYDWKADLKDVHGYEGNDVGVIAQEIEEVLPQIVTTRENGYKAVKYEKLVALLIEGIKAQQNQIDSLTIEIENLKKNNSL